VVDGGERVLLDDIGFLLARASAVAVAAANVALQPLGLTARAFATLTLAVEDDGVTQRGISDFLRLDPSRVVAIVDDLERRGLVARLVAQDDRRLKVVVATTEGRALFREAAEASREAERGVFRELTSDTRSDAIRVLRRLAFPTEG
jgi:DNA-binding MarR family transcriptional regulator